MMDEEKKFKLREKWNNAQIITMYLFKEPFFEIKRAISGYYNSMLLFYMSIITYIYLWKIGVSGYKIKIAGAMILISYIIHFVKQKKWKEYYEKEYIQGKKI